jgi:hypothetical protein
MVKSEVSRNLSLKKTFQIFPCKPPKKTSNETVANQKVVGIFLSILLDIKFVLKGLWKHILEPHYCGVQMQFWDSES